MEQTSRAESARSKINDEEFQAYVAERRLKSAGTATTPSRDSLLMKRESSSKLRRSNRLHGDAFDEIDKPCQVDDDEDGYDKETEHRISSTTGVNKVKRRTILKSVEVSKIRAIFLSTSDEIPLRGALRDSRSVSCSTSCYSDERDPVGKRGFIYKQE